MCGYGSPNSCVITPEGDLVRVETPHDPGSMLSQGTGDTDQTTATTEHEYGRQQRQTSRRRCLSVSSGDDPAATYAATSLLEGGLDRRVAGEGGQA